MLNNQQITMLFGGSYFTNVQLWCFLEILEFYFYTVLISLFLGLIVYLKNSIYFYKYYIILICIDMLILSVGIKLHF